MTKSIRLALALGTSVAFAGAAFAQPTPEYVKAAGASDLYEMQSSKLVASSANPQVRKFAMQMISDHTKSTAKVEKAVRQSGMTPKPAMLMPKQAQMIAELRAAKGSARDAAYVRQQKMAHQEALATHQAYASSGDKPALKMAAREIVPVVQHHIMELDAMPAM